MSAASTAISYPSLRVNSWATDALELDSTASTLCAATFYDLYDIIRAAPMVVPTFPPIIDTPANPDYSWDVGTTPVRIHAFLIAFATRCPHIPPSAYLEALRLTQATLKFIWDHPVMVRNIVQELELFFMRTFWNVAVRYDDEFTEDVFHELTDYRYMRCLDPSSKLILKRQMDVEDRTLEQRGDMTAQRVEMCIAFADASDEAEAAFHGHQPPAPKSKSKNAVSFPSVEESVSMEILPSELESLADVELALEEALSADIDISEELEAEAVDLSMSLSNRAITNTPSSTMSAPANIGAIPDIMVNSPGVEEVAAGAGASTDSLEVEEPEAAQAISSTDGAMPADDSGVSEKPSLLPPRLAVRTRPPYGSQSTTPSEASLPEEASESAVPVGVFPFIFTRSSASSGHVKALSISSSTTGASSGFGTFSKGSFMGGSMFGSSDADSFVTSVPSIPSLKASRLTGSNLKSGSSRLSGSSTTNTSGSESDTSLPTNSSLSADSGLVTPGDTDTDASSPSGSKIGSFMRRLVKRRGDRKGKGSLEETTGLASPGVLVDRSEFDMAMGIEFFDNRDPYHAIGWDGQPMKPKGPLRQLLNIPKLYWELKMAERRGEA